MRTAIVLLVVLARPASADRGALSLDVGAGGAAESVRAPYTTTPMATTCYTGLALLGARYAIANPFELTLGAFGVIPGTIYQNAASIKLDTGIYPGTLQHQYLRFGATAGARLVLGMNLRFVLGVEAGWSHVLLSGLEHWDDTQPGSAVSYGLQLANVARNYLLLSPLIGLEWATGDHWSLSLLPRLQLLLPVGDGRSHSGSVEWAVVLPLQFSWFWYL